MNKLARLLVLAFAATAALAAERPKNVILLVADGMGPAHVTLMSEIRGALARTTKMPVMGMQTTWCADHYVTDSAAAGTALATGVKAKKRSLGRDADGVPVKKTVLTVAEEAGKSTGLVTTAKFFDATPAAFASQAEDRYQSETVIDQMLAKGVEVIAGAGATWFAQKSKIPLTTRAESAGYQLITTRAALDAAKGNRLLAVFPEQTHDVDNPDASLPVLARWAIERLSQDKDGFFLLIEHEGVDSTSHQNDEIPGSVEMSLASFDESVGIALDFANKNPGTLVVVTSDHETGGMLLMETKEGKRRVQWSSKDHTAIAVTIFAQGPGASSFAGFMDNTDVGKRLMELVGK